MKKLTASILAALVVMSMTAGCKETKKTTDPEVRTSKSEKQEDPTDPSDPSDPSDPTNTTTPTPRKTNTVKMDISNVPSGYYDFVAQLTSYCAANGGDDNVMISPTSAFLAMSMVEQATEGATNEEILNALLNGSSDEELVAFAKLYSDYLQEDELQIANSFWMCKEYTEDSFKQEYIDLLQKEFNADIQAISFDATGEAAVNTWVSDHTNNKINDLIKPGDLSGLDQGVAVICNAVAFDGSWAEAYKSSHDTNFTDSHGNVSSVPMLYGTENSYISGCGATGFVKNYEGGKFAFMALLPDDASVNGNEFLASLTAEDYQTLWNSREYAEVNTVMPKFESDYSTSLVDAFESMGINIAFDDSFEFTRMLENSYNIKIAKISHQTHIKVDEEGTQAEAATAVIIAAEDCCEISDPYEVRCDRPFAYAIVDTSTGLPIFIGSVNSVA